MSDGSRQHRMETLAVHGGERRPGPDGAVVFPIHQSTVFAFEPGQAYHELKYNRLSTNPTQVWLGDKLAAIEGAEAALPCASGMAALVSILFTLMRAGDHLLLARAGYGGTHDFVTRHAADFGWTFSLIDGQRPETWEAARTPSTRLLLMEAISNPLMRVPALLEAVAFARRHKIVSVIDATLASPVNFRPLAHGFDLVFHSATKYLNGHSDLVAGAVLGSRALVDRVKLTVNHHGGSIDPHAAFLLGRGLKTLAVRVRAHNENALALAHFLARHPRVAEVNYPGLEDAPDYKIASQLFSGFGGMLSLRLRGGAEAADRLLGRVRLPFVAPSLGGVESLITRPTTTSHSGLTAAEREELGITPDLVRVSVGIEAQEDLLADFAQALE